MDLGKNLLGIPETLLPEEPELNARYEAGDEPVDLAARFPASSLPWALLAKEAYDDAAYVESKSLQGSNSQVKEQNGEGPLMCARASLRTGVPRCSLFARLTRALSALPLGTPPPATLPCAQHSSQNSTRSESHFLCCLVTTFLNSPPHEKETDNVSRQNRVGLQPDDRRRTRRQTAPRARTFQPSHPAHRHWWSNRNGPVHGLGQDHLGRWPLRDLRNSRTSV